MIGKHISLAKQASKENETSHGKTVLGNFQYGSAKTCSTADNIKTIENTPDRQQSKTLLTIDERGSDETDYAVSNDW